MALERVRLDHQFVCSDKETTSILSLVDSKAMGTSQLGKLALQALTRDLFLLVRFQHLLLNFIPIIVAAPTARLILALT